MKREIKPLWQVEKEAILSALEKCGGNIQIAAKKLEVGKTTVYNKLKKYGWKPGSRIKLL